MEMRKIYCDGSFDYKLRQDVVNSQCTMDVLSEDLEYLENWRQTNDMPDNCFETLIAWFYWEDGTLAPQGSWYLVPKEEDKFPVNKSKGLFS